MKHHPPQCSPAWTDAERRALAAFITAQFLDRIRQDDPRMPVLAKRSVYEVFRSLHFLLTASAEQLEAERAAFEKPFDESQNYHGVLAMPGSAFVVRDRPPEKATPDLKAQIKDALDLKGWTERRFMTCVDGYVCPHCSKKYVLDAALGLELDATTEAVLACLQCSKMFRVTLDQSPLGKAWLTEALP